MRRSWKLWKTTQGGKASTDTLLTDRKGSSVEMFNDMHNFGGTPFPTMNFKNFRGY